MPLSTAVTLPPSRSNCWVLKPTAASTEYKPASPLLNRAGSRMTCRLVSARCAAVLGLTCRKSTEPFKHAMAAGAAPLAGVAAGVVAVGGVGAGRCTSSSNRRCTVTGSTLMPASLQAANLFSTAFTDGASGLNSSASSSLTTSPLVSGFTSPPVRCTWCVTKLVRGTSVTGFCFAVSSDWSAWDRRW